MKTYDNIWKITIGREDIYITSLLLGYPYFNKHKMIAKDLV